VPLEGIEHQLPRVMEHVLLVPEHTGTSNGPALPPLIGHLHDEGEQGFKYLVLYVRGKGGFLGETDYLRLIPHPHHHDGIHISLLQLASHVHNDIAL